jgi:tRNA(Ile)-lysidine synthase
MAHDLEERFRASLQRSALLEPPEAVLVAVSGGIDSVSLLHLLHRFGCRCTAVHVNYRLRGHESDADASFVEDLCRKLGVELHVSTVSDSWAEHLANQSLQDAARAERYRLFEEMADTSGLRKIAVAHNLDDQAETIMLRLIRGVGILGLVGMRPRRPVSSGSKVDLVRPLLDFTRAEIAAWARENRVHFREDRSNQDPRFDRVRMRSTVTPALVETFGESALRNIARSAWQAQQVVDAVVLDRIEEDLAEAQTGGGDKGLSVEAMLRHSPGWRTLLLLEAARRWIPDAPQRTSVAEALERLLSSQSGRKLELPGGVVWRSQDSLLFVSNDRMADDVEETTVLVGENVLTSTGTLIVETPSTADPEVFADFLSEQNPNEEIVDGKMLNEPLSVGAWRNGEVFQPLGLSGRRKVSDFLTDQKVEAHLRRQVPVLRSGGKVVWVVGHRLADPFKVGPATSEYVRVRFLPTE